MARPIVFGLFESLVIIILYYECLSLFESLEEKRDKALNRYSERPPNVELMKKHLEIGLMMIQDV